MTYTYHTEDAAEREITATFHFEGKYLPASRNEPEELPEIVFDEILIEGKPAADAEFEELADWLISDKEQELEDEARDADDDRR